MSAEMASPGRPVGVLTISDRSSAGERPDTGGDALADGLEALGWRVARRDVVPDEREAIAARLREWADEAGLALIVTTGGTGLSPRDVTPEATLSVTDRMAPGIAEALRADALRITPHGMLSRGVAAIRGRTLIVNLPGNPKAVVEGLEVLGPVLPHAVRLVAGETVADGEHRPGSA